jgi:hypothetical protein
VKVPDVGKLTLNVVPGAITPEFQPPASPVDVWVMVSVFVHVTDVPIATVSGFGLNAFAPRVAAFITIATLDDPDGTRVVLDVTGVADTGDDAGDDDPQPTSPRQQNNAAAVMPINFMKSPPVRNVTDRGRATYVPVVERCVYSSGDAARDGGIYVERVCGRPQ